METIHHHTFSAALTEASIMIIPTAQYDSLFADDGIPFQTKMIEYIEREFSDVIGDRRGLLRSDAGLETLSKIISNQLQRDASRHAA